MRKYGKWEVIGDQLGSGGQGVVYLAIDTETVNKDRVAQKIVKLVQRTSPMAYRNPDPAPGAALAEAILMYGRAEDPRNCGALKILHDPEDQQSYRKQLSRMQDEINALRSISHPHILPIIDENLEEKWFVARYCAQGPLSKASKYFEGDFLAALFAFRPLVDAVATLHRNRLVHRDIKPSNVFFSSNGSLVLGDFGLVYFVDEERTRLTDTYENVGSRDWMPGWAMGMRIEDVHQNFDVFSLGKLLWSMVSGRSILRLWYIHDDEFELEKLIPNKRDMRWARYILDRCVVEKEADCLANAGELLEIVDEVLEAVRHDSQVVAEDVERICTVCGLGRYNYVANEDPLEVSRFGLTISSRSTFKAFTCERCGHVQLFFLRDGQKPKAWQSAGNPRG